jgi:starch synthase (maltosyl-transferring)
MKIYNLFPLLAGPVGDWQPHLKRAAAMGFDWVFVNPVQRPGRSGSIYSIADYLQINPVLVKTRARKSPDDQVRTMTEAARGMGLRLMIDLVINHCAVDSGLISVHPEWFVRDGKGVANPFCVEADGNKVVWRDLAQFDHTGSADAEGLLRYCGDVVEYLIGLGFTGFRCDAAYQIPGSFWQRLIRRARSAHPQVTFVAETLGCSPAQTRETAAAGFDWIFNSAKWWDYESPWLLEQHELTRQIAPSIGFPESHDTPRLYAETNGNLEVQKQRYLFTALFSAGVMMPMGYEFGFRKRLDVIRTGPGDWEQTDVDLTAYVRQVNAVKDAFPVFQEDGSIQALNHGNPAVLVLWKGSAGSRNQALLIINKDPGGWQHFHAEDLYRDIQVQPPLVDVSPEWPMAHIPTPFSYDLPPAATRVLVAGV